MAEGDRGAAPDPDRGVELSTVRAHLRRQAGADRPRPAEPDAALRG
ncbi:hypothetical protein ACFWG0_06800 [Streptomyces yangpuensis]